MPQPDLLEEMHAGTVIPADKNVRFLNYVIDVIAFYLLNFLAGVLLGLLAPDFVVRLSSDASGFTLFSYMLSAAIYWFYYAMMEGSTKGKTLGKLITRTRAVKADGAPISWPDAIKRSFARMVPFEPFSGLGTSLWHDRWTDTTVVKEVKM